MSRFLKDTDYDMQIKSEIKNLLAAPAGSTPSPKLIRAEDTAISQMKKWLSGTYDVAIIFTPAPVSGDDTRDQFIVTTMIDLALYHLYSQTGNRDVPVHRKERYQDALDWLMAAGKGEIKTDLPALPIEDFSGDVRISSREPDDHKW